MVVLPSAFTIKTGKAHWETLLKARAIENLYYIIAPNEVGLRANGLGTYGHSMIIGPWGEVLASAEGGNAVLLADIDLDKMSQLRQQFPSLIHYRSFVMQNLVEEVTR
jgi:nitrilase